MLAVVATIALFTFPYQPVPPRKAANMARKSPAIRMDGEPVRSTLSD